MSGAAVHRLPVSPERGAHIQRLRVLRDEALMRSAKVARLSPVAHEWAALDRSHRIVFLLLSGIDESEELTVKAWHEYTPNEARALQQTMRDMKAAVSGLNSILRVSA